MNNGALGFPAPTQGRPSSTTVVATASGKTRWILAATPIRGSFQLFKNGHLLAPGTDYTLNGNVATFVTAPTAADVIVDRYITAGPIGSSRHEKVGSITTPNDVAGILTWIEAASLTGLADNDPAPSVIQDLSPTNNDATKVSTVTYKATAANGQPCLQFASAGYYSLPSSMFSGTTQAHAFILLDSDSDGGDNSGMWWLGGNDHTYYTYTDGNIYDGSFTNTRYSYNPTPLLTDWHVYEVKHTGSVRTAYLDGTTLSTQTIGYTAPTSTGPYIGATSSGSSWDGRVAAFVAYNVALGSTDANTVRTYLNSLAGL